MKKSRLAFLTFLAYIFSVPAQAVSLGNLLSVPIEATATVTADMIDSNSMSLTGGAGSPVDIYPATGDYTFSWLGFTATGYNTELFATPGAYSFTTVADADFPSTTVSMVVGDGQLGMHSLVDWNMNTFDVFVVWDILAAGNTLTLTATDMDNDGIRGYQMVSGPFVGTNFVMDATIVTPIPAAFWLFGSGLTLLSGIAKKRQST
ncbi:MAG TPA: hypothetical protein ENJ79_04620 [Gammaproteobacteria bacterium]|nr:hypothetical protein [Gammaproteobacteria bacterium]